MISPFDSEGRLIRDICIEAMLRRDEAYDGVFFVCVRTTKIYCRPVCRVRMPRPENVRFVPSAAAAEHDGYRPCLRCRPESAPWSAAWLGTEAVVRRGLTIIHTEYRAGLSSHDLAHRLGIGPRHLSRLFRHYVGATPHKIIATCRLQQAKRLITDTDHPFCRIAFECGFGSVRRFNDSIRNTYGRTPSALRQSTRYQRGVSHAYRRAVL